MPHVISVYSDDKSNNFVFIWKYIILSHFIYVPQPGIRLGSRIPILINLFVHSLSLSLFHSHSDLFWLIIVLPIASFPLIKTLSGLLVPCLFLFFSFATSRDVPQSSYLVFRSLRLPTWHLFQFPLQFIVKYSRLRNLFPHRSQLVPFSSS